MRFLPLFLDLQSGVVLLVGAGDLVRAKLRLLVSAGAQVRWFATDGNHDLSGLDADDVARIGLAKGDPLASDPLWHVSLGTPMPTSDMNAELGRPYPDLAPEAGITSTPVIDLERK
jgi:hypothetical protein